MTRDRTVASGSTIEGGGAMLVSPSRVPKTGSGTEGPKSWARLAEDQTSATQEDAVAGLVGESREEVHRRRVVAVVIGPKASTIVAAAPIDTEALLQDGGALVLGCRDAELDFPAAGSDAYEHVHLGRRVGASL